NSFITRNTGAQPTVVAPPTARMRIRTTAPAVPAPAVAQAALAAPVTVVAPPGGGRPGRQIDLAQVTHEARAKMMWGDTTQQVMSFLMIQGLPLAEAKKLAEDLFKERASTVRKTGFRKIFTGIGMILVS